MAPALRLFFVLSLCMTALAAVSSAWADPPGRVGRLSLVSGEVVLRGADDTRGTDARLNWPLTDGDVLSTGEGGRAEIRVGSSVLRLDEGSELVIQQIDDEHIRVWLEYGRLALRVRNHERANAIEIEARHGIAMASEPGQYRLDTDGEALALTAYRGRFRFQGRDDDVLVRAGERVELGYGGSEAYAGAAEYDEFADWSLALDRRDDARDPPRYVSREMTGVEDLQEYGDWDHDPSYGAAWFPRAVHADWAPYRWGRWVHVQPWGWTWVDDAPWGFAPFHYGRWVLIRGRWAWLPGSYVARPLYAPALVVWIGAPDWQVDFSFGRRPAVGWFPLGPREVYVPRYRCSTTYVRRINVTHVTQVTRITEVVRAPERHRHLFRHQPRAVTVVPREALADAKAVAPVAVRDPKPWAREVPLARTLPGFVERRAEGGRESEPVRRTFSPPRPDHHRLQAGEAIRQTSPREPRQALPEDEGGRERREAVRRRGTAAAAVRDEAPPAADSPDRTAPVDRPSRITTLRQENETRQRREADADAFRRFQAEQRSRIEAARERVERAEERRLGAEPAPKREPEGDVRGRFQSERRGRAEEAVRAQAERGEALRRQAEASSRREEAAAAFQRLQSDRREVERGARVRVEEAERRARGREIEAPRVVAPAQRGDPREPVQLPQEPRRGQRESGGGAALERILR